MAILCASQRHRPTAQKWILIISFPLAEDITLFNWQLNTKNAAETCRAT
jgi:hypothetical protein